MREVTAQQYERKNMTTTFVEVNTFGVAANPTPLPGRSSTLVKYLTTACLYIGFWIHATSRASSNLSNHWGSISGTEESSLSV
jgi:hypothetical protein